MNPVKNESRLTLEEGLHKYLEEYARRKKYQPKTRETYARDIRDFFKFISATKKYVDEVDLNSVRLYQADLDKRGLLKTTYNKKTEAVKSLVTFLEDEDIKILKIPFAGNIKIVELDEPTPLALDQDEYSRLLRACDSNLRDRTIFELILQTGLRISEVSNLKMQDLSIPEEKIESGSMRVVRKGGKINEVILNPVICKTLRKYLKERMKVLTASPYLFLNKFKTPIGNRAIQRAFRKYADIVGLKKTYHPHNLRNTYITQQFYLGTPATTVQHSVGHERLETTAGYFNRADKKDREILTQNVIKYS